jgi:HPt (histidine-containing phosphotransfer) domain-containing protein
VNLPGKLAALTERFVADAAVQARELGQQIASGDYEAGRQRAHSLAGRSGMFGFPKLGEIALAADEAPSDELPVRLEALLAALEELAQRA